MLSLKENLMCRELIEWFFAQKKRTKNYSIETHKINRVKNIVFVCVCLYEYKTNYSFTINMYIEFVLSINKIVSKLDY